MDPDLFPKNGSDTEKLEFLLRYSILAPSPYNNQPWLFDIYGEWIDLIANRRRSLSVSDPFDRELVISCGTALAFMHAAANAMGYELGIDRFPDPNNADLLARVWISDERSGRIDYNLLVSILNRQTNRNAFDPVRIANEERAKLNDAGQAPGIHLAWIDDANERKLLAQMIMETDKAQFESSIFMRELASWTRPPGSSAPDGLPEQIIGFSGIGSYTAPLPVRTFDVGNGRAARDDELMHASPGVIIISTSQDHDPDWLNCGEALGLMLLTAEQIGLRASYLNQPCQVSAVRLRLGKLPSVFGYPQLILRVGRTTASGVKSTRLPLESVLRDRRHVG